MTVSIVIPVYNSSATIFEAMDSVVRECVVNPYQWELIVVDDGSKDDSVALVEQYIASSSHKEKIKLIKQPNGGAAVARNTGIKVAQGEFIAFNDSDDRWLAGKLKLQIEYMRQHPDVGMVGAIYGKDNMSKIKALSHDTRITIKDQVLKCYFSTPTVIFRKFILDKTGLFNEYLRHSEEGYFFNNIIYYYHSVLLNQIVSEPILDKGRWGGSGLSGNIVAMEQGELFNIMYAYKNKYISLNLFICAYLFSVLKFCRRWLVSKLKNI